LEKDNQQTKALVNEAKAQTEEANKVKVINSF
jgi:hypothetical protein